MTEQEAIQRIYAYYAPTTSSYPRGGTGFLLETLQEFLKSQGFDDLAKEIERQS